MSTKKKRDPGIPGKGEMMSSVERAEYQMEESERQEAIQAITRNYLLRMKAVRFNEEYLEGMRMMLEQFTGHEYDLKEKENKANEKSNIKYFYPILTNAEIRIKLSNGSDLHCNGIYDRRVATVFYEASTQDRVEVRFEGEVTPSNISRESLFFK